MRGFFHQTLELMGARVRKMQSFFHQTLELMGARVRKMHQDELSVRIPENSPACCLLGSGPEHRLSFSSKNENPRAIVVVPGSALLETATQELGKIGSVRHSILPSLFPNAKKDLKNKCVVFTGTCEKFSCRHGWQTTVRLWVKATLAGDEVVEILEGVEISPDGRIRRIERPASPGDEVQGVEKPPMKLYRLRKIIEEGMAFAENLITNTAEELQTQRLKRLYSTLEKLRTYYHQLGEEMLGDDKQEARTAVNAEYERRKLEEIQYARVKAVVELIAVETISTPIKNLHWNLARKENSRRIEAQLNLYDNELISTACCSICQKKTWSFGLTRENELVCPSCYIKCEFCGDEFTGKQAAINRICSVCEKKVCREHGRHCETCGKLVCKDHQVRCAEGCRICPDCIQVCSECGQSSIWCKSHTAVNSKGNVFCRSHAVFCIGCREHFPTLKAVPCDTCGQTVCQSCRDICRTCAGIFCLNHVNNGECEKCQKKNSQTNLFQSKPATVLP